MYIGKLLLTTRFISGRSEIAMLSLISSCREASETMCDFRERLSWIQQELSVQSAELGTQQKSSRMLNYQGKWNCKHSLNFKEVGIVEIKLLSFVN